jgi:hypothetical protein
MKTGRFIAIAMIEARIAAAPVGRPARERMLIAVDRIIDEVIEAYLRRIHEAGGSRSG